MEENNNLEQNKDRMGKLQEWYLWARFLFIIVLVVAVGVFAVNQALEYRYKAEFLKTPCNLCKELNKNQSVCIEGCFKYELRLFPDSLGNWKDYSNKCYDFSGKEIECKGSELMKPINASNLFTYPN